MRVVIGRIDAPGISGTMMRHISDAVHDRVTEQHHLVSHVNLRAQHVFTFVKFAGFHTTKQIKVFVAAAASVRTVRPGL